MNCETFHLAIGTFPPNGYDHMEWLMKKYLISRVFVKIS
nr:hypothetical protein [Simonsiella muelleri]